MADAVCGRHVDEVAIASRGIDDIALQWRQVSQINTTNVGGELVITNDQSASQRFGQGRLGVYHFATQVVSDLVQQGVINVLEGERTALFLM